MSIESMAAVLHHSRATGTDKLVLLGIANHDGDGGAYPTIETLSRYANCTTRSVQRSIARLIELEEIEVLTQLGGSIDVRPDRRPNRYIVLVRCPSTCDGSTNHRTDGVTRTSSRNANGVTSMTERGDVYVANGVTSASPEPSLEPSNKPKELLLTDADASASAFVEFWEVYPRKVGKRATAVALLRALKRASAEEIIDGARRFANDPNLPSPRFVPHPSTWLNRDGWLDEPLPALRSDERVSGTERYLRASNTSQIASYGLSVGDVREIGAGR